MNDQEKQLPRPIFAIAIILFSFIAGAATAAGVHGVLVAKSRYYWLFDFAMAFFLLISSASYAQRLIKAGGAENR